MPSSWPQGVSLPDTPRFRTRALAWLWTLVPDTYWGYPVLREHPLAVAFLARRMLIARYETAREGHRTIHQELDELIPPHHIVEIRAAYLDEGHRLMDAAKGLDLVHRAMRGEVLTPKSADPARLVPRVVLAHGSVTPALLDLFGASGSRALRSWYGAVKMREIGELGPASLRVGPASLRAPLPVPSAASPRPARRSSAPPSPGSGPRHLQGGRTAAPAYQDH
jgi:hypothetical protein